MDDLVNAWSVWSTGRLDGSHLLWGLEVFWWGRIGKLLQTMAILAVVAELIGPERLKVFGNSLHSLYNSKSMKRLLLDAFLFQRTWLRANLLSDKVAQEALEQFGEHFTGRLNFILITSFYLFLIFLFWAHYEWWSLFVALLVTAGFISVSGLLTFLVVITFVSIGLVLDLAFIEPTAWIISHEKSDKLIKLITLFSAIIGLHFDILAS